MKPTKSLKQKNVSIDDGFYTKDDIEDMMADKDTFFTLFEGDSPRISLSKVSNVFVSTWGDYLAVKARLYDGREFYVEL